MSQMTQYSGLSNDSIPVATVALPPGRSKRTAVLTVLGWNALVMSALVLWLVSRSQPATPESPPADGMVAAAAVMILILLFALWSVGGAAGALLAATIVRWKMREAARRSEPPTISTRTAVLCGTVATPLGWMMVAIGAVAAGSFLQFASFLVN